MSEQLSPYAILSITPDSEPLRIVHGSTQVSEAALVGTAITVQCELPLGTFTGSVISAPVGSTATWSSNSFTPDVAGRYRLKATNDTVPITFDVIAFPAAAWDVDSVADKNRNRRGPTRRAPDNNPASPTYGSAGDPANTSQGSLELPVVARPATQRRAILRGIARGSYGTFSDATFAALTTNAPVPLGIDWGAVNRMFEPTG
jgi:hypothetical protein